MLDSFFYLYYWCSLLLTVSCFVVGFHFGRRLLLLWLIVIFSVFAIIAQVVYLVIWAIEGNKWSGADAWWANLIGFMMYELPFVFICISFSLYYMHTYILCFLCMPLQIPVLEIPLCSIFFVLTTISSCCCFSWFVWKQI